jgi:hypothetical protein
VAALSPDSGPGSKRPRQRRAEPLRLFTRLLTHAPVSLNPRRVAARDGRSDHPPRMTTRTLFGWDRAIRNRRRFSDVVCRRPRCALPRPGRATHVGVPRDRRIGAHDNGGRRSRRHHDGAGCYREAGGFPWAAGPRLPLRMGHGCRTFRTDPNRVSTSPQWTGEI